MPEHVDIAEAARRLRLSPARVRALASDGELDAIKVGGRWLVVWDSVLALDREERPSGRPLDPRNAWAVLFVASGEPSPPGVDAHAHWRLRRALEHEGLAALRSRLGKRAEVKRFWCLPGELRAVQDDDALVFSGSSAAGALGLALAAPNAIDAYVPESSIAVLAREHALEGAGHRDANVVLRAVPGNAWFLDGRRNAPEAAVALDLASYPDARSQRAARELIARLDAQRAQG